MNAASQLETMEAAKGLDPMAVDPALKGSIDTSSSTDDGEFEKPTEEELATLRRVSGKIPWVAYTVAFVELCERFSYYGTTAVCKYILGVVACLYGLTSIQVVNFIQQPLPEGSTTGAGFSGQSGALNMGQRASTGLTTLLVHLTLYVSFKY
jgi:POT family proton-dependent oligopeptide transporter